jgi:uncharacterized protein with von Willebrand factor type A (vWA) domain
MAVAPIAPDRIAVAFVRVLRGAGLDVPVGSTIEFVRALDRVGLATPAGVYWAGRATLIRRPDDISAYDRAFAAFWNDHAGPGGLDDPEVTATVAFDVEMPAPTRAIRRRHGPRSVSVGARWRRYGSATSRRTPTPNSQRRDG